MAMTTYSNETLALVEAIATHCTACQRCTKDCLFLQSYCETPKDLFSTILEEGESQPLLPYSCLLCGHCTVVCPLKLELGEAFLAMRQDLVKANGRPLKQLRSVDLHQFFSSQSLFKGNNRGGRKK